MLTCKLGKSGIKVSAMGLGCWAIGDPWLYGKTQSGWGEVDDDEAIRAILIINGRTLAQAALGWIWARSERTIPIPGFKTVKQVKENVGALEFGPLSDEQMRQIDEILDYGSVKGAGL